MRKEVHRVADFFSYSTTPIIFTDEEYHRLAGTDANRIGYWERQGIPLEPRTTTVGTVNSRARYQRALKANPPSAERR